ncbi:carboxypeptidase A [Lasiosphaeria hispida]|uniref:Carboxypeptidase A n=1 Tax=Lasiosphaeria hispida TaxID=260671 RepID=A0AAJ0HJ82_9PEZI|nr:carboxypeptidase A [Lasiosphaeria hispida]
MRLILLLYAHTGFTCLLEVERLGGHWTDSSLKQRNLMRGEEGFVPQNVSLPVGQGDRFNGGTKAPRGLGVQPKNSTVPSILNLDEINSALAGLSREFGLEMVKFPTKTYENRTILGAKTGNFSNGKVTAYIESGIHARERGGPDHVLYFISDLLWAQREKTGLTYGGVSYTHANVQAVLDLGIVFFPTVNPDGLKYDLRTNDCWRKNRNPASANSSNPNTVGVDLNRNFDFLWDFPKYFAPGVQAASKDPASVSFAGTTAFSEPETQGIRWAVDEFPNLGWFVDIHSTAATVLYPFGDDSNQIADPSQNWANSSWDGQRGVIPDRGPGQPSYQSYISEKDRDVFTVVAGNMANRVFDATGSEYSAKQIAHLYPTSGSTADYVYAHSLAKGDGGKKSTYGFGLEFGQPNLNHTCGFYPTGEIHNTNVLEVGVALMEFLLGAVKERKA